MIHINSEEDLFNLEPMKYWAFPANTTDTQRQEKINMLLNSNEYCYSLKTDGNLIRAIITKNRFALQTRGIVKSTGTYGEIQDKVFWANDIKNAFNDTTVLLGEAYIDGGTDKTVGAVLRCLTDKALARQTGNNIVKYRIFDVLYYNGTSLLNAPLSERIKYLSEAEKAINNELVTYVKYYNASPNNFWDNLSNIFSAGGEGVVLYRKTMTPTEGRTPAWQTIKVKQMLHDDIDAFITGVEPANKNYTGKELSTWKYWIDLKTDTLLPEGQYYSDYYNGKTIAPVTRTYYYGLPGAIICSVYDNNFNEIVLCKCSNLTDELSLDLKKNFEKYNHKPCKINGMLISHDRFDNVSIRHPKLIALRDDIDIMDCRLDKII